jgi:hypothetical protein
LRARSIIDIFSGISPAIGLMITARTMREMPTSSENPSSEAMNGPAPKKMPAVPAAKANVAFVISPPKKLFEGALSLTSTTLW